MSDLFRRALIARTTGYPRLVQETESAYAKALAIIDGLHLDPSGDIVAETERFREQLRNYDLAMMSCLNRAEGLLADIHGDLSSIDEYNEQSAPYHPLKDLSSTLVDLSIRLMDVRSSCKEHRKIADRGRRMVTVAQEQKSLRRLILLIDEMKSLDNEATHS